MSLKDIHSAIVSLVASGGEITELNNDPKRRKMHLTPRLTCLWVRDGEGEGAYDLVTPVKEDFSGDDLFEMNISQMGTRQDAGHGPNASF